MEEKVTITARTILKKKMKLEEARFLILTYDKATAIMIG